MPLCLDCENQVAFVHHIRGTETRFYKANGEFDGAEYQQFEPTECWCDACESPNVIFEVDPAGADGLLEPPDE